MKVVHTADVHFGMENYGFVDSKTGLHARLLDFKKTFDFCIDYAITHKADLFIFAGDAYRTSHPTPTHQKLFLNSLMRLYKAGIPVVIVIGNHDHSGNEFKAHALDLFNQLPLDGFYIFNKPKAITLELSVGKIQIIGIPWPNRSSLALAENHVSSSSYKDITSAIEEALRYKTTELIKNLDKETPAILVGHLTVSSGTYSGSEKKAIIGNDPTLHVSHLAQPPISYVALGHLHCHQNLNKKGDIPVVYSGSLECIDFGESKDTKGFCVIDIQQPGMSSYEFITCPSRIFLEIEIKNTATECDHTEYIVNELKKYNLKEKVIKVVYHAPGVYTNLIDARKVKAACSNAWFFAGLHVVGAIAKKQTTRAVVSKTASLKEQLETYCKQSSAYKDRTKTFLELLEKYQNY